MSLSHQDDSADFGISTERVRHSSFELVISNQKIRNYGRVVGLCGGRMVGAWFAPGRARRGEDEAIMLAQEYLAAE